MGAAFRTKKDVRVPDDQRQTPLTTSRRYTTAAGAVDGSSLVDSGLTALAASPTGLTLVLRPDDDLNFEVVQIAAFNPGTGQITPHANFSAQVPAGTPYAIVSTQTAASAASVPAVAGADSAANVYISDVIGNKTDTAAQNAAATKSLVAYAKGVVTALGDPTGGTLTSITARLGNLGASLATMLGYQSGDTIPSLWGKLGNGAQSLMAAVGDHSGDTLTSARAKLGNLSLSLATILQPAATDASAGPSNFFAGAVTVVTLSPAQLTMVGGVYLDCNGFTNGATLTATIQIKVGAGNNVRQVQRFFTKDANNTLWPIIDGETPIKAAASSLVIQVQSDNAADTAVIVPSTAFTRNVS